jgi:hypothetical protein
MDSSETGHRWYVRSNQLGSNCWETAYADPLDDVAIIGNDLGHPSG